MPSCSAPVGLVKGTPCTGRAWGRLLAFTSSSLLSFLLGPILASPQGPVHKRKTETILLVYRCKLVHPRL